MKLSSTSFKNKIFQLNQGIDMRMANYVAIKSKNEELAINKLTLGKISPVFNAMFEHELKEKQNGCVEINDFKGETIRNAISFILNGDSGFIHDLSYEQIKELYSFAYKYNIELLTQMCECGLMLKLTMDNYKDTLEFAIHLGIEKLIEMILEFYAFFKC